MTQGPDLLENMITPLVRLTNGRVFIAPGGSQTCCGGIAAVPQIYTPGQ
jgi:hypothetical protein